MGQDNFAKFKIIEAVGENEVKIIPEILITGGENGGPMSGLLGMELPKMVKDNEAKEEPKNRKTTEKTE